MGQMLERMHNVASRDMLPQKRRKIYDERAQSEARKAEFHGGGRGGVIGEYMREKKEEGQKENLPVRSAVDISAGMIFFLCSWFWIKTDDLQLRTTTFRYYLTRKIKRFAMDVSRALRSMRTKYQLRDLGSVLSQIPCGRR